MPIATAVRPGAMSLATPSSISRDLRTPSPRLSAVQDHAASSSNVSPLVLASADGELSKICGSLVEPEEKRQRWACCSCKAVFARDATIYLPPSSTSGIAKDSNRQQSSLGALHDATASSLNRRLAATTAVAQEPYCKACYADKFSLGDCFACTKPVLGSTKEEGKFVKSSMTGYIWHGRCYMCTLCGASGDQAGVCLGLDGLPTCAECFDRPKPRRHVASTTPTLGAGGSSASSARPPSPFKDGTRRRASPPTASLSGVATRQPGMGATIAELSRKFGRAPPASSLADAAPGLASPKKSANGILPQHSGRQSPVRGGLSRSNSLSAGARPLTAQFSGQGFNLAAFQPSTPTLQHQSDSRSRSSSPTKEMRDDDDVCSKCFKGPFDGPFRGGAARESRMVVLQQSNGGGGLCYHAECFSCAVCSKSLENATRSFVRLDDGAFAHPGCAPPPTIVRQTQASSPKRPASITSSTSSHEYDHATHQRLPRPTLEGEKPRHNLPTSYLMGSVGKAAGSAAKLGSASDQIPASPVATSRSSNTNDVSASSTTSNSIRRFQPTSGAAPPTRSTLLHTTRTTGEQSAAHRNASLAVSSGARFSNGGGVGGFGEFGLPASTSVSSGRLGRLGGMQMCGGCNVAVSSLEGVPGPRGQTWHRKCLVCSAPPTPAQDVAKQSITAPLRRGLGAANVPKRCGKQLDSSAKVTADGQLRCRECYDRERTRHRICT